MADAPGSKAVGGGGRGINITAWCPVAWVERQRRSIGEAEVGRGLAGVYGCQHPGGCEPAAEVEGQYHGRPGAAGLSSRPGVTVGGEWNPRGAGSFFRCRVAAGCQAIVSGGPNRCGSRKPVKHTPGMWQGICPSPLGWSRPGTKPAGAVFPQSEPKISHAIHPLRPGQSHSPDPAQAGGFHAAFPGVWRLCGLFRFPVALLAGRDYRGHPCVGGG